MKPTRCTVHDSKNLPRVLGALILAITFLTPAKAQSNLEVVSGVDTTGSATDQWLEILQRRLPASEYASTSLVTRTLTAEEQSWDLLIRNRSGEWGRMTGAIADLYLPAQPPRMVLVVTGNRGANDAFVHDPQTIGFDLSALQSEYGSAALAENTDRIDRLFGHEYAHLMQKAWFALEPYSPVTPLEHALLDIWAEGLGTYHSLSDRWRSTRDGQSAPARETLAALEPRFLVRLAALTCATPDGASKLVADLSMGQFTRKWGALTAGLWLENQAATADSRDVALKAFIHAGPDGVWDLAAAELSSSLQGLLQEIIAADQLCR